MDAERHVQDEQGEGNRADEHSRRTLRVAGDQRAELQDVHRCAEHAEHGDGQGKVDTELLLLQADKTCNQDHDSEQGRDQCCPAGERRGDIGDGTNGDEKDAESEGEATHSASLGR
ncbi:hypothetical protein ACFFX0_31875 [Citricoccus parietis]|uniref:Uncharacterized protein n=1 Tax=Citricoccus parietis TaxID=592307 RepID=A0ABV5G983_9MICC